MSSDHGTGELTRGALVASASSCYPYNMSTLAEIETAADVLSPQQKQELLLFLVTRLRAEGTPLPEPRKFPRQQIAAWIEEDESDMRRFNEGE